MTWVVLQIFAGLLLLASFVVGLICLIRFVVKSLGRTSGDWRRQVEGYATARPPAGQLVKSN